VGTAVELHVVPEEEAVTDMEVHIAGVVAPEEKGVQQAE
jgi:hypothetical protein